ncbi:SufE family protein [Psychromonas ossibalaenae]|uniref:SufE family protein n=1 Tax=Psychromonas ossibalaenae TaxID=444922 RepID=UPI00036FA892|nr:SufE family protein [Psychromonas ossibalaenae]
MTEPLMTIEQLLSVFTENKSWDKQYRLIIQLGKQLPPLADSSKIEVNQVKGCESLAWLLIENKNSRYNFKMDSDTRVVKGLMMILLAIFQGKTAEQIHEIDIKAIFAQLGLLNHLSPSRANGLLAIVEKIQGV